MLPQISILAASQVPPPVSGVGQQTTPSTPVAAIPLVQQVTASAQTGKKDFSNTPNKGSSNTGQTSNIAPAFSEILNQTEVKYAVDKATGIITFTVVDPKTKKVIRQVPSEEILAIARRVRQQGLLIDKEG